jgi:hypothetical protein
MDSEAHSCFLRRAEPNHSSQPTKARRPALLLSLAVPTPFKGKKLNANGELPGQAAAEITSDLKQRQEGVRIKHRYKHNSVKMYDNAYIGLGSLLRTELTMEEPEDFKVYRHPEGHPESPLAWLQMRGHSGFAPPRGGLAKGQRAIPQRVGERRRHHHFARTDQWRGKTRHLER